MAWSLQEGSIVQLTIRGRLANQTTLNVLHYQVRGTGLPAADGGAVLQEFMDGLTGEGFLVERMRDCCASDWQMIELIAQEVYFNRYTSEVHSIDQAGTLGTVSLPPQVNAVIIKRTDNATRWGRGTFHIPGISVDNAVDGEISPVLRTAMGLLATQLITSTAAASGPTFWPVLWNVAMPLRVTDLTSAIIGDVLRVLRRRQVRLGI